PAYTIQDDKFWFSDGSIILISEDKKAFRVHLVVLAMHSQYFKDMVEQAQPSAADAADHSLQQLPLADSSEDISCFLHFIYTPWYFTVGEPTPFKQLSGMLRLSTKYLCDQLRQGIIKHLMMIYPRERAKLLPLSPLIPAENKVDHSLLAIQMGQESNIPEILPIAFYHAATIDPIHLLAHPDVSSDIKLAVSVGRACLVDAVFKTAWRYVCYDPPDRYCGNTACQLSRTRTLRAILANGHRAPFIFMGPQLHECSVWPDHTGWRIEMQRCNTCLVNWKVEERKGYNKVWEELPTYFGLGGWAA
ncbi:hypothetical protein BDZ89DRAFT_1078983, partial [Hymenopellis radicata]